MSERLKITSIPLSPEDEARYKELRRKSEIRANYLVPIHIMWTGNISSDASKHALAGVIDTLTASGQDRDVAIIGSQILVAGEYENADWYVSTAYKRQSLRREAGFGPQLDTSQFSTLFTNEPLQDDPHWDVLILNHDLDAMVNGAFINFVFGETSPQFPYSVQSIIRIENATSDRNLNLAMIRNLLRHETGHMFGLVGRKSGVESLGTHCPNPCSLKQALSIKELAQNTIEVENSGKYFCDDCMGELAHSKDKYKLLPQT